MYPLQALGISLASFTLLVPAGAQTIVSASFDTSQEGFGVQDIVFPFSNPPVTVGGYLPSHYASGGAPGGYISMTDPSPNWFFFQAPAAFLGDKSVAYHGTISLDMRVSPAGSAPGPLLILVGAGMTLFASTAAPGVGFTHFDVALVPSAWLVNDPVSGAPPTAAEMLAVLSNLVALYISGDWVSGYETADLDNVAIARARAQCTFRNGSGVNVPGFACTTMPVLGTSWISSIATTPGTVGTWLGLAALPDQQPLWGGELLLGLAPPPVFLPGAGTHSVPIPNAAAFVGAELFTQGFRVDTPGGVATIVILNAQDLVLGV